MTEGTATIEEQQMQWEMEQARMAEEEKRLKKEIKKRKKKKLTFSQKVSEHWLILTTAGLFDLIGLIPGIAVVVNFIFGLILWLYFILQKTKGGNDLIDIGLPILGGSVADFFVGVLPVNITATLIKIYRLK